jgi:hypothetical protein
MQIFAELIYSAYWNRSPCIWKKKNQNLYTIKEVLW